MNWTYALCVFFNVLLMASGRPQVPEGLGDTISSIGGTVADLIRYIDVLLTEKYVVLLRATWL